MQTLEERVAFQDASIEQLDQHVQKLNNIVQTPEAYCKKLEVTISQINDQASRADGGAIEIPPHY
ncbi:MAG: SlyX family protein [Pseudomonadota bacterium]|nr:SlyX family protein [Pseudomonadota bacterium]